APGGPAHQDSRTFERPGRHDRRNDRRRHQGARAPGLHGVAPEVDRPDRGQPGGGHAMTTDMDELDGLQILQSSAPPAPPSPALLASINEMRPFGVRVPFRTLLVVAAAAVVFPTVALAIYPLRRDLYALPPLWFAS